MHTRLTPSVIRALALFVLAGSERHLHGQYPGQAENQYPPKLSASAVNDPFQAPRVPTPLDQPAQQPADLDLVIPDAVQQHAPSQDSVSVAELEHPLSRKGRALLIKAQNDLHAGKTAEGLAELGGALKEPSAVPYAHSVLGAAYLRLGRISEAIPELEQAVQLLPIAANYANLGYARCISGDTAQGQKALQRALELDASSPQAHYLIGLLLLDTKSRNNEACEQFERAQRTVRSAHMALAVCYVRGGLDDAADRQVKEFVGTGDDFHLAFWKRWANLVASLARPSTAFGLRAQ